MKYLALLVMLAAGPIGAQEFDHQYADLAKMLGAYVRDGLVDYRGIKDNPNDLLAFCSRVEMLEKETFDDFTTDEKLAFWLNVYNAYTLRLVMEHYPVKSIRDIKEPWKREYVLVFRKRVSLDHIENGIIRKKFSEPRIHFALVCAALGCPVLQEAPYTSGDLNNQLSRAARAFLADTTRNKVQPDKKNVIYLSEIFKWYGDDFTAGGKALEEAVAGYAGVAYGDKPKIKYLKYDWALNGRE